MSIMSNAQYFDLLKKKKLIYINYEILALLYQFIRNYKKKKNFASSRDGNIKLAKLRLTECSAFALRYYPFSWSAVKVNQVTSWICHLSSMTDPLSDTRNSTFLERGNISPNGIKQLFGLILILHHPFNMIPIPIVCDDGNDFDAKQLYGHAGHTIRDGKLLFWNEHPIKDKNNNKYNDKLIRFEAYLMERGLSKFSKEEQKGLKEIIDQ
ncbi:hypothetical protein H8356DRAFT_1433746 [Neocallimastix lanati (nom. inval.)]|nr:hypothetical protein H8356DRAFT_1433746 [Neocallimastix sp. JGI-2020a]